MSRCLIRSRFFRILFFRISAAACTIRTGCRCIFPGRLLFGCLFAGAVPSVGAVAAGGRRAAGISCCCGAATTSRLNVSFASGSGRERLHPFQGVEVYFERLDRNEQFADRDAERNHQQDQRDAECVDGCHLQADVDQEGADDAQQQAAHAEKLHLPGHVKPPAQVGQLQARDGRRIFVVVGFQVAHDLCVREETVRISQQDQ